MIKIHTASFHYNGADKLDITIKNRDPLGIKFAPTWPMVMGIKKGTMTEDEYLHLYFERIKDSPLHLINKDTTLVCYCPPGAFCHRIILAEHLENLGLGVYVGERNLFNKHEEYLTADILDAKFGIICHQVNCMGVMGAGIALQIRKKWPVVYDQYMRDHRDKKLQLGSVSFVRVGFRLYVANMASQYTYGRNKRFTNYQALRKCLQEVRKFRSICLDTDPGLLPAIFPYKMSCSLAGGDWYLVSKMIRNEFPNYPNNHRRSLIVRKEG